MTDRERQQEATKRFLCCCGSTLMWEYSSYGIRIICYDFLTRDAEQRPDKQHDEPTAWCASREDAVQIREVIRAMTRD